VQGFTFHKKKLYCLSASASYTELIQITTNLFLKFYNAPSLRFYPIAADSAYPVCACPRAGSRCYARHVAMRACSGDAVVARCACPRVGFLLRGLSYSVYV